MKIAFDAQLFLKGDKTGIAWNAHYLILELAKDASNECVLQCFAFRCTKEQLQVFRVYQDMGCRIECCHWFKYALYKLLWVIFPVPHSFFFHTKADITQFFNFAVPPGVKGKRIAMIHDMAYKSYPHTVNKKTRVWLELCMKKSCRHADHIVTVSDFSKREIIRYLHVSQEKITVVPNAVDHTVYHANYTEKQIQKVLDKYQVEREYFLYLGTIEPRKNLERLLGAYEKLYQTKKKAMHIPQMVLAGKKGWLYEGIYEKARRLNMGNKILFLGYVAPQDSPLLMCGAKAFVFPSLYEGFGMPPLEAMACGTPVITSNTAALPEVAGGAGILVNPESEEEICRAMQVLLEDDAYRKKLSVLGLERAAEYTWQKSASLLFNIYQELCHGLE